MTPKDLPELTGVQAFQNTDREVWRETPGDFYSNSVHLTATGGLGINVGGTVYVKPPAEWHRLASGARSTARAGSPLGRDADWALAIKEALGGSVDAVPIVPTVEALRKLFDSVRSTAAQPLTLSHEEIDRVFNEHEEAPQISYRYWVANALLAAANEKSPTAAAQPVEPMASYSHVTGGARFQQRACDQLPPWAYDVRPEPPAASGDSTPPSDPADGEQLWLWRNGDHFLAFRHLYPCYSPNGDPMTLGEPFGRAIFKHSHNREGKPNEQQRTDRQSPRSGANPDIQRRRAAGASQACAAGAGASLGYGEHQAAPQVGWGACSDGAREQQISDIAGAAGVLAAGRNFAQGVAAQGDSIGALRPEPEAVDRERGVR